VAQSGGVEYQGRTENDADHSEQQERIPGCAGAAEVQEQHAQQHMQSTGQDAPEVRGLTAAPDDQADEVDNPRKQQADAEDGERCQRVYRNQQRLREGQQASHQTDAADYQAKRLFSGRPRAGKSRVDSEPERARC
jgi:hypothetical protein